MDSSSDYLYCVRYEPMQYMNDNERKNFCENITYDIIEKFKKEYDVPKNIKIDSGSDLIYYCIGIELKLYFSKEYDKYNYFSTHLIDFFKTIGEHKIYTILVKSLYPEN